MWFKSDGEQAQAQDQQKQTVSMKIGPISFTLQQVRTIFYHKKLYKEKLNIKGIVFLLFQIFHVEIIKYIISIKWFVHLIGLCSE